MTIIKMAPLCKCLMSIVKVLENVFFVSLIGNHSLNFQNMFGFIAVPSFFILDMIIEDIWPDVASLKLLFLLFYK